MNIKRAKEEIRDSLEAYLLKDEYGEYEIPQIRQRPILLMGAPGIGKTQIMEQIAKECKVGLVSYTITHHTRQSAIGLPFISEKEYGGEKKSVTEYTMSEIVASIYDKIAATGLNEGILFIDEINCVSETLAPAMLQFLQCKTFGSHAIPEGWMIVAAGNPPEYNKSVRDFDVVTMDRLKKIDVEPDLKVWKEYAYQVQMHPAITSYLDIRPAYFYQMEQSVDGKMFVTPRGWEDLSRLIYVYEKLEKTADREVVQQYLQHPKVAKDFANYLELYYKYKADYQIEEIFAGHISESVLQKLAHASFDERLSVISLLTDRCFSSCRAAMDMEEYLTRLLSVLKHFKAELRSMAEKAIGQPSAGKLTDEELSRLISGEQAADLLEKLYEEEEQNWKNDRAAGILQKREDVARRKVVATLDLYARNMRLDLPADAGDAYAQVKESFALEGELYDNAYDKAGKELEYAFDFMETAFGVSQEMVTFITEIGTGREITDFLQTYECERYYRYSQDLLLDDGRKDILQRIEEV